MPVSVHTERELRQVLAELELVSQVPALDYASKSANHGNASDECSPGGKRPIGGIDRGGDHEPGWSMRSLDHFRDRCSNVHSEASALVILGEARTALEAYRRPPAPLTPELSSPQWKRWVGETSLSVREIARIYNVSRQYVDKIRTLYSTQREATE